MTSCCMSMSNKITYSPVVPQHTCFGSDGVLPCPSSHLDVAELEAAKNVA